MLSGKVVKIGSPKKFFRDEKQWKYRVLYVDQRGPMNSGTIGRSSRKIPWSCVAYCLCFFTLSVAFHLFSSVVAFGSEKCAQLPVVSPLCPGGTYAFCDRLE